MDPDPDPDAAAMAQAMGFSSFGAQDHAQKKRRYNAAADSITSAPSRPSATGSNSTPLGTPSAKPAADSDDEAPSQEQGGPPPAGLPARPAPAPAPASSSESHASRAQRQRNEPWYTGYYDSTSNENPWERLEKAMGLQTKGIWVLRSSWTPPPATT